MLRILAAALTSLALLGSAGVARADAPDAAATDRATTAETAGEREVADLTAKHDALARRYQDELAAVDNLKKQRASWRRDRELRASLSTAADTANQLTAAAGTLAAAQGRLVATRRALIAAIDAELPAASPDRAKILAARKQQLAALVGRGAHRIVLPDTKIDPLADPEELDQQAAALRASEDELSREVAGLDSQAAELDRIADLRKHHDRASDLANRDDDAPVHAATHGTDHQSFNGDSAAVGGGVPSGGPGTTTTLAGGADRTFEAEATVALADVVDASTIDSLSRASRSGDPAQRAAAAHRAHDAVALRLEQLRKKRAEVEARAKTLRTH
ncbi:MAG TPA: hypothetical protein VGM88_28890 [Kofleriaceae bacterium]